MDVLSVCDSIPLLIIGDNTRISEEKMAEHKKWAEKAKQVKLLITKPSDNTYIQYKLKLKEDVTPESIKYVHDLIDQMMASTQMSGMQVLRRGKTANDIKRVLDEMLYSDTLSFGKLRGIYVTNDTDDADDTKDAKVAKRKNNDDTKDAKVTKRKNNDDTKGAKVSKRKNNIVIEEPIRVFLGLFDIEEKKECSVAEFEDEIEQTSCKNKESWERLRASIKSAPFNTVLLENITARIRLNEKVKSNSIAQAEQAEKEVNAVESETPARAGHNIVKPMQKVK